MKKLIKLVLFLLCVFAPVQNAFAVTLTPTEVLYLNSIGRFIDTKPEGSSIKQLERALKSSNLCVKGIGSLILYKHYGRAFRRVFLTSFTLNQEIGKFARKDRKYIKLENVNKILEAFAESLSRLKDERIRRLFLFFHFRSIDLWLVGKSGEKLSMAVFYRISSLESVFGPGVDVTKLLTKSDSLKK